MIPGMSKILPINGKSLPAVVADPKAGTAAAFYHQTAITAALNVREQERFADSLGSGEGKTLNAVRTKIRALAAIAAESAMLRDLLTDHYRAPVVQLSDVSAAEARLAYALDGLVTGIDVGHALYRLAELHEQNAKEPGASKKHVEIENERAHMLRMWSDLSEQPSNGGTAEAIALYAAIVGRLTSIIMQQGPAALLMLGWYTSELAHLAIDAVKTERQDTRDAVGGMDEGDCSYCGKPYHRGAACAG